MKISKLFISRYIFFVRGGYLVTLWGNYHEPVSIEWDFTPGQLICGIVLGENTTTPTWSNLRAGCNDVDLDMTGDTGAQFERN